MMPLYKDDDEWHNNILIRSLFTEKNIDLAVGLLITLHTITQNLQVHVHAHVKHRRWACIYARTLTSNPVYPRIIHSAKRYCKLSKLIV